MSLPWATHLYTLAEKMPSKNMALSSLNHFVVISVLGWVPVIQTETPGGAQAEVQALLVQEGYCWLRKSVSLQGWLPTPNDLLQLFIFVIEGGAASLQMVCQTSIKVADRKAGNTRGAHQTWRQ